MSNQYSLTVPDYINQAFWKIHFYGATDDAYEAFASRWGAIDFDAFRHVVEVGDGDDRLVAMFAVSFSGVKEAADVVAPLLQSEDRKERWVSALSLGYLHDERAFPALQNLVLDALSLDERIWAKEHPDEPLAREILWTDYYRYEVIELLDQRNYPSLGPTLRQTFISLWNILRKLYPSSSEGGFFDDLTYLLGKYHELTVLDDVNLPSAYKKVALVYLALGVIQAKTFVKSRLVIEMFDNKELKEQVSQILSQYFDLSAEEQEDCVENFRKNIEARDTYGEDNVVDQEEEEHEEDDVEEDEYEEEISSIDAPLLSIYKGHTKSIHSLSWSPDGVYLVSGGGDLTAQVWEAATGKHLVTFPRHFASVNVVAWSPKGDLIASGGNDNTVYVWEALTGKQVMAYYGHRSWICRGLGWSPDGKRLASASWDHTVQVWEALTGKTLLTYQGHEGAVVSVAWSPDGTRIATGGGYPEAVAQVWDAQTGTLICSYRGHCEIGDTIQGVRNAQIHEAGSVRSLSWSPDGTRIVTASTGSYMICRVWDATNGQELLIRDSQTWGPVIWGPDGTLIISPGRYVSTVDRWNATTNETIVNYAPATLRTIEALAWSADGKRIAASDALNTVQVWEAY